MSADLQLVNTATPGVYTRDVKRLARELADQGLAAAVLGGRCAERSSDGC